MRKLIKSITKISVILCFVSVSGYAQVKEDTRFTILNWQTKNGVNVYFVQRPEVPMLDLAVVFTAGSAYDKATPGLASFTSAMIGEGTAQKTAEQIAKAFDSVGAQTSSSADRDKAVVSLRTLTQPNYFDKATNTLIEALTCANFPEKAFGRVKQQVLDTIKQNLENPSEVASTTFYHQLYGNGPYGHPVLGTLTSVKNLSRKDVIDFYHRYYISQNAKIIMVGDLTKEKAKTLAEAISSRLGSGTKAKPLPLASAYQVGKNIFVPMPVAQNTIILGENGIKRQNENYFSLIVANHILGGSPLTSLLFDVVRNKNALVYGIYSGFSPLAAKGPFAIWLQTRAEKTQEAIKLVHKVLQTFAAKGPTETEIVGAQKNILGSFPIILSTNHGIISNVVNVAFYNLPLDFLEKYRDHIKQVTAEGAKIAFANQVKLNALNTVIVGRQTVNAK